MSAGKTTKQKKADYFERLVSYLETYPKMLVVSCDNIGSSHMQMIRKSLRGKAVLLMGKNTLIRRAIRENSHRNEQWNAILPLIYGNVGLVFTKQENLSDILDAVQSLRVPAAAKAGVLASKDVYIPKGPSGLEPTKTHFLSALNIPTKIARGQIEFINDIHLIKKGERVGSSEAAFLQMLNVKPFEYGLIAVNVYENGSIYHPDILKLKDSDILSKFAAGVANVASLSLELGIPTLPAFPHAVLRGYHNLVAIAIETEYDFDRAQKLKEFVKNPSAFVAAPAPSDSSASSSASDGYRSDGGAPKPVPVVVDEPVGGDVDFFDLFGNDESSVPAPASAAAPASASAGDDDCAPFDLFADS
jgi:large subunit ribosomal protein LP0